MNKTFWIEDLHGDARPLRHQLYLLGWRESTSPKVLFLFHDTPARYAELFARHPNAKVVVYSHGEPVNVSYDGIWEPHHRTELYLSSNYGNTKVMEDYGYPVPIKTIGWHYSPIRCFRPVVEPRSVLFAPIHPLDGWLHPQHKEANKEAFQRLLKLKDRMKIAVRHIGAIEDNGLWYEPGVDYRSVNPKTGMGDAHWADVVVSYNRTFLAKCVALGIPAVAYAQDYPWFDSWNAGDYRPAKTWDQYADFIRFPYDLGMPDILKIACNEEPTLWKSVFIGFEMTSADLDNALKDI